MVRPFTVVRRSMLAPILAWVYGLSHQVQAPEIPNPKVVETQYTLTPTRVRRLDRLSYDTLPPGNVAMFDRDTNQCTEVHTPVIVDPCGMKLVDAVGDYGNHWDCGLTLLAPTGYTLSLEFHEFDLHFGDILRAWDGCTPGDGAPAERKLIPHGTGSVLPSTVVSQEECMHIEFKADDIWTRRGFNATIHCNTPMPGGSKGPAGPDFKTEKCFNYVGETGLHQLDCMMFMHPGVQCVEVPPPRSSWDGGKGHVIYENQRWWPSDLFYHCDPGYHVTPRGCNHTECEDDSVRFRSCQPSRQYTGFRPDCSGNWCDEESVPEGMRRRFRHRDGELMDVAQYPCYAEYACAPGYIMDLEYNALATQRRQCDIDAHWDGMPPLCHPAACPANAGPPGICVCNNGWDGHPHWDDSSHQWTHSCSQDQFDNFTRPLFCSEANLTDPDAGISAVRCHAAGSGNDCRYTPYVSEVAEDCTATATPICEVVQNTQVAQANHLQQAISFQIANDACVSAAGDAGVCVYRQFTGTCAKSGEETFPVENEGLCENTGYTWAAAAPASCTNSGNATTQDSCEQSGNNYTAPSCTNGGSTSSESACELVDGQPNSNTYSASSCSNGATGVSEANCTTTGNTYTGPTVATCTQSNGASAGDASSESSCEQTGRTFTIFESGALQASCTATLAPACDAALYAQGEANCLNAGGTYVYGNNLVRGCAYTHYVAPITENCSDACALADLSPSSNTQSETNCLGAKGTAPNAQTGSCKYTPHIEEARSYCYATAEINCAEVNMGHWNAQYTCNGQTGCSYSTQQVGAGIVASCTPPAAAVCAAATGNCSTGDAHTFETCELTGNTYSPATAAGCTNGDNSSSPHLCEETGYNYSAPTCLNGNGESGDSSSYASCQFADFYQHIPTGYNYTNSTCTDPSTGVVLAHSITSAQCLQTGNNWIGAAYASCTNGGDNSTQEACERTGYTFAAHSADFCTSSGSGACSYASHIPFQEEKCEGDIWNDYYTHSECVENDDEHGFSCSTYISAGYSCNMMVNDYNYDCHCACLDQGHSRDLGWVGNTG